VSESEGAPRIEVDDLSRPEVIALLREHLEDMRAITPAGSVHALDLAGLRRPDITFWTIWNGADLLGTGALRELASDHGEIKSMRTPRALRRRGAARAMLAHLVEVARSRGYRRLSLETGAMLPFAPAHRLYESTGFVRCDAFAPYVHDPNSVFMTRTL
jgi:putative acetyltransferase